MTSKIVGICLLTATLARAQGLDHFQTVDRARQLIREGNYEEAISVLAPVYMESFSAANEFAEAYRMIPGKRQEFMNRVRPEAENGNPFVSYALANEIRNAYVREPRSVERYFLTASNAGIALASEQLGHIYFYGLESSAITDRQPAVMVNIEKSREMFERCADDKVVRQECSIGLAHALLELRPGKPQDAIELLESVRAFGELWGIYYFGVVVPIERTKAAGYLAKAKNLSPNDRSLGTYDVLRYADKIESEVPSALVDAAFSFGVSGRRATGIPGGPKYYVALLERAFRAGSAMAAKYLGDQYYFGELVRKDPVLAFCYYSAVTRDGSAEQRREANSHLDTLEQLMSTTELTEARSLARQTKTACKN